MGGESFIKTKTRGESIERNSAENFETIYWKDGEKIIKISNAFSFVFNLHLGTSIIHSPG